MFTCLSFNLRVDSENDLENRFLNRREVLQTFFNMHSFDLIGFQEVRENTYQFLTQALPHMKSVIVYRDDVEATPIFYDPEKFELVETKTFWLSDTPDVISKYEESAFIRICTHVVFKVKEKLLIFLNTHLDYLADATCLKQAKVIIKKIAELKNKYSDAAIILSGDFNQHPDSNTISYLRTKLDCLIESNHITYHDFTDTTVGQPIDYIFFQNIKPIKQQIITDKPGNRYLSDHYPVLLHFDI